MSYLWFITSSLFLGFCFGDSLTGTANSYALPGQDVIISYTAKYTSAIQLPSAIGISARCSSDEKVEFKTLIERQSENNQLGQAKLFETTFKDRVELTYAGSTVTFTLKKINNKDFGCTFKCTVSIDTFSKVKFDTLLIKAVPPQIQNSTIGNSLYIKHGINWEIPCRASGVPLPKVSWLVVKTPDNPESIKHIGIPGKAELKIPYATLEEDQNLYRCVAENVGGKDHWNVEVYVQRFDYSKNNTFKIIEVALGDVFEEICPITGTDLTYKWRNPVGEVVSTEQTVKHTIKSKEKDVGNYTCTGKNNVESSNYLLDVNLKKSKPGPPGPGPNGNSTRTSTTRPKGTSQIGGTSNTAHKMSPVSFMLFLVCNISLVCFFS